MSAAEVIEHARLEAGRAPRAAREVHLMARPSDEPLFTLDRTGTLDRSGALNRKGGLARVDGDDHDAAVVQSMGLDVVFPVLHGPYGEDGTVQGLLELANLPYVGCGVLASAVGMDKAMMKVVFAQRGLPQVDHAVVLRRDWTHDRTAVRDGLLARLAMPLFVKPANLGSSVGISKVHGAGELDAAMDLAAGFDRKIVVEAGVANAREIECAVLGNDVPEASVAGEVIPSREFYDYEAKYLDEGSKTVIPADLPPAQGAEVQRLTKAAFVAIDGAGLARVDFLLGRDDGRLYVNEVNTLPGFTTISMFSKLWEASGVSYPALIDRLIALALERHAAKQQLRTSVL
jgi:D-alanine-D-alanine ligase